MLDPKVLPHKYHPNIPFCEKGHLMTMNKLWDLRWSFCWFLTKNMRLNVCKWCCGFYMPGAQFVWIYINWGMMTLNCYAGNGGGSLIHEGQKVIQSYLFHFGHIKEGFNFNIKDIIRTVLPGVWKYSGTYFLVLPLYFDTSKQKRHGKGIKV